MESGSNGVKRGGDDPDKGVDEQHTSPLHNEGTHDTLDVDPGDAHMAASIIGEAPD